VDGRDKPGHDKPIITAPIAAHKAGHDELIGIKLG
jgi:hypothetical protein